MKNLKIAFYLVFCIVFAVLAATMISKQAGLPYTLFGIFYLLISLYNGYLFIGKLIEEIRETIRDTINKEDDEEEENDED